MRRILSLNPWIAELERTSKLFDLSDILGVNSFNFQEGRFRGLQDSLEAPEMRKQSLSFDISNPRNFINERRDCPFASPVTVETDRFSMGLIPDPLQKK